ncbi:MAG: response regulator transcription factor [Xenococcaceae cyanobacterium MO_188.B32]|nr:response regulator transcription factor [Xenococcaceae cyanobacterium MO_188.B32]
MIKLLLADDREMFRQGLAALLSLEADLAIVGEASNGKQAIALAESVQPDLILMDVRMPICNGVEATRVIHERFPWIKILVLTTFDNDEYVWQSLEAGALSYLLKSTSSSEVVNAVRALNRGHSQLDATIAQKVFSQLKPLTPKVDYQSLFSNRELAVLKLLGTGKSNKEIAKSLHLSEGTVRNHLSNIFCKLDVRDRTQAALWAQQNLGINTD